MTNLTSVLNYINNKVVNKILSPHGFGLLLFFSKIEAILNFKQKQ